MSVVKPICESDLGSRVVVKDGTYSWEGTLTGFSEDGTVARIKCWVFSYWTPSQSVCRLVERLPTPAVSPFDYN